jgi:hypothetical protein
MLSATSPNAVSEGLTELENPARMPAEDEAVEAT